MMVALSYLEPLLTFSNCLPKGRHSEAAHEIQGCSSQNVPGVGWGGSCRGRVGWGGGGSCRGGVGWVM